MPSLFFSNHHQSHLEGKGKNRTSVLPRQNDAEIIELHQMAFMYLS